MDVLVFELGGLRYALPAMDVCEVTRAVTIVPLPKAPAIVEGVINVRGKLVPVLDIRTRFDLPAKPLSHTDHLVLARAGHRQVAIRADRALQFLQVERSAVEDAGSIVPSAEHVIGVAKLPDGLVLIHDLRAFLAQAEAMALDDAVAAAAVAGGLS